MTERAKAAVNMMVLLRLKVAPGQSTACAPTPTSAALIEASVPEAMHPAAWALVAGAATMLLGMLAFVLRYTGHERWLAPRRFGIIGAMMLALTLLAWTNPLHHLYWRTIWNERS